MAESLENFDFKAGEVIQPFESPFLKCISPENTGTHCANCFQGEVSLTRCIGCRVVRYCSSECRKLDYELAHSIECKSYVYCYPSCVSLASTSSVRLLIRLLSYLQLHDDETKKTYELYNGTLRCFNNFVDNNNFMEKNADLQETMAELSAKLNHYDSILFSKNEIDIKNVNHLLGIWYTNGFKLDQIGSGLYIRSTCYNHSCRPNAIKVFDDDFRIQIRCIESIPHGTGVFLSYMAGFRERPARQDFLAASYFFICKCLLCELEKQGPLINYQDLSVRKSIIERDSVLMDSHFPMIQEVVDMMQLLFHKYDERTTNFCDRVLDKLMESLTGSNSRGLTLSKVKTFADDVKDRLEMTYGVEHEYYKYFIANTAPKLETRIYFVFE